MQRPIAHPLKNAILGVGKPGGLRWGRLWLPGVSFGWLAVQRGMRPLKVRWGWALILAVVLVLAVGEFGPAASVLIALP